MISDGLVKAAKGTSIISIQSIISAATGTFLFMFIARTLTPNEMGIFGAVFLAFTIVYTVAGLGFDYAASRYVPYLKAKGGSAKVVSASKRILGLSFLSSAVAAGLFLISASSISILTLGSTEYLNLFQISAIAVLTYPLSLIALGFLQGMQSFRYVAYSRLVAQAVRILFTVALIFIGLRIEAVLLGWIAFNVTIILFAAPIVSRELLLKRIGGVNQVAISWKEIFIFSTPMMGVFVLNYITGAIDQFTVLRLIGVESLGLYFVALNAASAVLTIFALPLMMTLTPGMSETLGKIGLEGVSNTLKDSNRYVSLFFIPIVFIIAALSPIALNILGGPNYIPAALSLSIICIGMSTYGFSTAITSALIAIGKTRTILFALTLAAIVEVFLSVGFTMVLDLPGAAIGKGLMYLALILLLLHLGKRHLPISFDRKILLGSLASSTLTVAIVFLIALISDFRILLLPVYLLVALTVYIMGLSASRVLFYENILFFLKVIPSGMLVHSIVKKMVKRSILISNLIVRILTHR